MDKPLLDRLYDGANSNDQGNALFREAADTLADTLAALKAAERCLSTPRKDRNKPSGTSELTNLAIVRAAISKAESTN